MVCQTPFDNFDKLGSSCAGTGMGLDGGNWGQEKKSSVLNLFYSIFFFSSLDFDILVCSLMAASCHHSCQRLCLQEHQQLLKASCIAVMACCGLQILWPNQS